MSPALVKALRVKSHLLLHRFVLTSCCPPQHRQHANCFSNMQGSFKLSCPYRADPLSQNALPHLEKSFCSLKTQFRYHSFGYICLNSPISPRADHGGVRGWGGRGSFDLGHTFRNGLKFGLLMNVCSHTHTQDNTMTALKNKKIHHLPLNVSYYLATLGIVHCKSMVILKEQTVII